MKLEFRSMWTLYVFGYMQLTEGIKIITFWGLASNIKQQCNKWTTIGDWQGEAKTKWFLNMNPCNNKQNRGFSVKGNRHVGWPREWDWQSGWRSQWQMMRLEQSRIACNPCEDGLKYKQKRRRRRRKRRYTAVCVTNLWCWKNWDSTRRSQLFAKFKPDQITIQRLRTIWREKRLNVTVWKCFRGDRTGWRRFESTLWKTWVWRTGEMNNDPGWKSLIFPTRVIQGEREVKCY